MARWPAGVWPEMCFAQSVPDGRVERVRCGITPGNESDCVASTKRSAFATDEWNVMSLRRSYFRIALAKPICAATRVANLSNGGGANGSTKLNSASIQNDSSAADRVNGGSENDWFIQSAGDVLADFDAEVDELKTTI